MPDPGADLDRDRAAVRADDAVHRGQAEATAIRLRREERVEHASDDLRLHAHRRRRQTVISTNAAGRRWPRRREAQRGRFVEVARGRAHANPTGGALEGVGGVDDEVHHHLLQLPSIAADLRQLGGEVRLQERSTR